MKAVSARSPTITKENLFVYLYATSHKCLAIREDMKMLPESVPVLKEKAAEQFERYDAKPLQAAEIRSLEEADRFFLTHKPR